MESGCLPFHFTCGVLALVEVPTHCHFSFPFPSFFCAMPCYWLLCLESFTWRPSCWSGRECLTGQHEEADYPQYLTLAMTLLMTRSCTTCCLEWPLPLAVPCGVPITGFPRGNIQGPWFAIFPCADSTWANCQPRKEPTKPLSCRVSESILVLWNFSCKWKILRVFLRFFDFFFHGWNFGQHHGSLTGTMQPWMGFCEGMPYNGISNWRRSFFRALQVLERVTPPSGPGGRF